MDHRRRVQCQQLREHQTADLRYRLPPATASLTSLFQWPVLRRLVAGQPPLRRETCRRSRYADAHLFNLMRGEDKQHAGRFFIAVEETMRGPRRSQQRIARANRDPLAAQERIEPAFLDDDGHFRVWIDGSWYPGIGRDRHLLDVERLAPLTGAHQEASLQARGSPRLFAQILLADDWHLHSFHDLPSGYVCASQCLRDRCITSA